ncbi:acyl-CoA dehydrogenase family protein [Gordonia sp. ABSL11-1]|uniref:acyl-CoA dehydrogenase family protein n=1 Tax=Gordonia sp. ABSL11-1 TaxID=3053924 RepID=UPI0025745C32|nr:acyl-CoA dehydrogenase family protein [Gordonia sp. ABSL11-1]MDL9948601.1 acyl-CoA dehydrogenase family protein [Gordonia sp. ABSL11-1]
MDHSERTEFQTTLNSLLAEYASNPIGLSSALDELGWHDVVADEPSAAMLLFRERGYAVASGGTLDDSALRFLDIDPHRRAVLYPTTVYPAANREQLFAPTAPPSGDGRVSGVIRRPEGYDKLLIAVGDSGDTHLVEVAQTAITAQSPAPWDPDEDIITVDVDVRAAQSYSGPNTLAWEDMVSVARRSLAAELVGLAAYALDLAIDHAVKRQQFGRSIGSFQATRFHLAEARVAVESAAEAVRLAYASETPLACALAKNLAGSATETACRKAIQVCGAMGLTWEFPLHRIVRRALILDAILGGHRETTIEFGRRVMTAESYPAVNPLEIDPDSMSVPI